MIDVINAKLKIIQIIKINLLNVSSKNDIFQKLFFVY